MLSDPIRERASTRPAKRRAIDFEKVLLDLSRGGYGVDDIAMKANLPASQLKNYLRGCAPLHEHGERLLDVWGEVSGKARELAPRMSTPVFIRPGY
jgi:hypothetical protein